MEILLPGAGRKGFSVTSIWTTPCLVQPEAKKKWKQIYLVQTSQKWTKNQNMLPFSVRGRSLTWLLILWGSSSHGPASTSC